MSSLEDRRWAGRSHPWCVYTRLAAALALIVAITTHRSLGVQALIPIGVCLFFIIINPFIFPAPKDKTRWATRSVLGQRLWRRRENPGWDVPSISRVASALAYFVALWLAFENQLAEAVLLGLIALGLKLVYLDWMARYHRRAQTA
ncbi:MAG: DUF6653 family protein [Hyphomicrobiaceae bacterium]